MEMQALPMGSAGFETHTVTSTAKGRCPKQRTGHSPSVPKSPSNRSWETILDSQSYGSMEERYGIQEEGIF